MKSFLAHFCSSWLFNEAPARRLALLLMLLVVGTFCACVVNGFVNYDDPPYVTENPLVQSGLNARSISWAFSTFEQGNWHPLTWLSHCLDCQVFGLRAWGHHLINVIIHASTTLLLFIFLIRTTGALWRSFFTSAIFGLHPLRVESVAWVAERKDVLSVLFCMLTLCMYVRFKSDRSKKYYLLALVCFALGLISKPMLVTLPCLLLLLDYWPLYRFDHEKLKMLALEKLPFFLLSAMSSALTFIAQQSAGAVVTETNLGLASRFSNAVVSYCSYIGKLLIPVKLAVFYPLPVHRHMLSVVGAAIVFLTISTWAFAGRRRLPYFYVGWFWFVGTLVPVIGLVQVGAQSMADRYSYLPSIGLLLVLVWGISEIAKHFRLGTRVLAAAGAGSAIACVLLTVSQIQYWKNSGTLFRHALAVTGENCVAWTNLGSYTLDQGAIEEAVGQLEHALQLCPSFSQPHFLLGTALYMKGLHAAGIGHIQHAIQLEPRNAPARFNLAAILEQQGRFDEAVIQFQQVLKLKPTYAEAYDGLGFALQQRGNTQGAVRQFEKAMTLKPKDGKAYQGLGEAMLAENKIDEALRYLREASLLKPNDPEIHKALGLALSRKGLRDEAVAELSQALRLRPKYSEAEQALKAINAQSAP
jgi:tetratricopeptide (TPR) repeat protein